MSRHIEAVTNALKRSPVNPLPRGELFIGKEFLDHFFGEFKGEYLEQLGRAAQCLGLSLVGIDLDPQWSQSLLLSSGYNKLEEYFVVGCVNGPIARVVENHGFLDAMLSLKKRPLVFSGIGEKLVREIDKSARMGRGNGFRAMALADDIAGNAGLLFSFEYFMEVVLPVYREIVEIIKGHGLFAFFHSDGDVRKVIKPLIEAGYDCLHPVDTQAGLDLYGLEKEFGQRISFMGHIDTLAWNEEQIRKEISLAEREFEQGGLILGSTGGISIETVNDGFAVLYPNLLPCPNPEHGAGSSSPA